MSYDRTLRDEITGQLGVNFNLPGKEFPTIGALDDLIRNPAGTGDLTTLLQQTPALAKVADKAFPELIKQMNQ